MTQRRIKKQIEALGGFVEKDDDGDLVDRHVMVSDIRNEGYKRTKKFLRSAAFGIPCVSHHWVESICEREIARPTPPSETSDTLEFE